ncbi:hypothetical protein [Colwellia sp. MT2012]|nr:hypothetical protein [Colwellia sp. MT2012]
MTKYLLVKYIFIGSCTVIMVSHEIKEIEEFCDSAIVLPDGKLTFYADLQEAIEIYKAL